MRKTVFRCAMLAAVMGIVPTAAAVVMELSGEARSQVRSFVGGAEDSSDESIEVLGPESSLTLPISTRAELETLLQEGDPEARGVAIAKLCNPEGDTPGCDLDRATSGRNPEEIALEAGCFSNDATAYEIATVVVEERLVRLSAEELGASSTVQSAFFPSGAIFLWSLDADRDLTDVSAEVSFVVRRFIRAEDGTEQDSTVLLDEVVSLSGGPAGACLDEASSGIFTVSGDLTILPDMPGLPFGNLSTLAVACLSIIPETQQLDYEYEATADEPFILEATVTVNVANLADGTGVFAAVGSFNEGADIIATGIAQATAKAIQARVNRAIAEFESQAPAVTPDNTLPSPCGILGFDMVAMLMFSYALFVVPCRLRIVDRRLRIERGRSNPQSAIGR